jgi:glycerol-3-phosphate dehydrogenase
MSRLRECGRPFDVAIVGGGIVGAGVARDAALRGLRVALIERADFGGGTTAASTRLIHGGLRYLETLDLRLVRMDLRERETLLHIAPHLVKPLPFLVPLYRGVGFSRSMLRAGMLLYDLLSFEKSLPRHRFLSAGEARALEPALRADGLTGAALYYDAQVSSPERLAIENIVDAHAHGAVALNYVEATGVRLDRGRVSAVQVVDRLTGEPAEVAARVTVNASGPWFDRVGAVLATAGPQRVRTTKGIHVAARSITQVALLLHSRIDGRVVFSIPWAGHCWFGTTDSEFSGDPATAHATDEEIDYLLRSAADYVPAAGQVETYWSCAGVRALARKAGPASRVSRRHHVVVEPSGVVSIIGGKITGFRQIAADATDAVCRALGHQGRALTATQPLPGGRAAPDPADYLATVYGTRASEVRQLVDTDPQLGKRLSMDCPDIGAQVVFSVRHEFCRRLEDFMLRRSFLGFRADRGRQAASAASLLMKHELGWSEKERLAELAQYHAFVDDTATRDARAALHIDRSVGQS